MFRIQSWGKLITPQSKKYSNWLTFNSVIFVPVLFKTFSSSWIFSFFSATSISSVAIWSIYLSMFLSNFVVLVPLNKLNLLFSVFNFSFSVSSDWTLFLKTEASCSTTCNCLLRSRACWSKSKDLSEMYIRKIVGLIY